MPKSIIVYSTPTCPYCHMVMDFLKSNNVPFTHKDVAVDQAAAEEMIDKSGQMGVPVIDVDGEIIVGFDKTKIEELIQ